MQEVKPVFKVSQINNYYRNVQKRENSKSHWECALHIVGYVRYAFVGLKTLKLKVYDVHSIHPGRHVVTFMSFGRKRQKERQN